MWSSPCHTLQWESQATKLISKPMMSHHVQFEKQFESRVCWLPDCHLILYSLVLPSCEGLPMTNALNHYAMRLNTSSFDDLFDPLSVRSFLIFCFGWSIILWLVSYNVLCGEICVCLFPSETMFHAGEIADCLKPGSMAPCEPHMHMTIKSPF